MRSADIFHSCILGRCAAGILRVEARDDGNHLTVHRKPSQQRISPNVFCASVENINLRLSCNQIYD